MQPDLKNRRLHFLMLTIIVLLAVAVRLLPWGHVFSGGTTYFTDGDCYVRFRKILVYLNSFPATFVYDYFEGFPVGTGIITPPIMEYLMAACAFPFRRLPSLIPTLQMMTALIPPLIGGLTVGYVYQFAGGFLRPAAALTAALFLALAPSHVDATILGRFDNEMVEPLLLLLVLRLYCRTYNKEKSTPWLLTGIASAFYLIFWRGALFPLSILGIDLLRRLVSLRSDQPRVVTLAWKGTKMYGAAAAVVGVICLLDPWQTGRIFSYHLISPFHIAVFAAAALLFAAFALFRNGRRLQMAVGCCLLVTGLGAALVFRHDIFEGLRVVTGGDAWIDTISEYVPGFSQDDNPGYYGLFGLMAPLALFTLFDSRRRSPEVKGLLVLWTLVMFAATVTRLRFACYYAVNASLMAGLVVDYASTVPRRSRRLIAWAAILVTILLQGPVWTYFEEIYRYGRGVAVGGDLEETMLWLRDQTPAAGDPYRPARKPSYGVLARWDLGGYIEGIALRPTVATGYGKETYGLEESVRAFLAPDDAGFAAIVTTTGTRYLIVDDTIILNLNDFAQLVGDHRRFFENKWDPVRERTIQIPTKECLSLAFWRLLFADGLMTAARGVLITPVEGVRLVYESASTSGQFPWQTKRFKVFEVAGGAILQVAGREGSTVEIVQPVETNQGRQFVYRNRKKVGTDGLVRFALPYTAKTSVAAVGAVAPVTVMCAGIERTVRVTDREVMEGKTVTVTLR